MPSSAWGGQMEGRVMPPRHILRYFYHVFIRMMTSLARGTWCWCWWQSIRSINFPLLWSPWSVGDSVISFNFSPGNRCALDWEMTISWSLSSEDLCINNEGDAMIRITTCCTTSASEDKISWHVARVRMRHHDMLHWWGWDIVTCCTSENKISWHVARGRMRHHDMMH